MAGGKLNDWSKRSTKGYFAILAKLYEALWRGKRRIPADLYSYNHAATAIRQKFRALDPVRLDRAVKTIRSPVTREIL